MTERMKSTVQTEDSEHIPQTEQNGGTSTEDMKSKSLRNEMQIGGRVNESRRIKKLRKRKKARFLRKAVAAVFCVAAVIAAVLFLKERFLDENYRAGGLGQAVNGFLKEGKEMYKAKEAYQSIDKTDENADTLKDLLDKNPETWEFVKNYSKMKDASPADTIGEVAAGEIPLLLQWDERWGYSVYGDNMIAVNGCGPGRRSLWLFPDCFVIRPSHRIRWQSLQRNKDIMRESREQAGRLCRKVFSRSEYGAKSLV